MFDWQPRIGLEHEVPGLLSAHSSNLPPLQMIDDDDSGLGKEPGVNKGWD